MRKVKERMEGCTLCPLCETRKSIVFGEGNENTDWMLIGEAPGKREDEQGRPFVGRSGKLLDEMLTTVGTCREEVYITNIVCCRPPGNRDPLPEEIKTCYPFLLEKIKAARPAVITTLGKIAAQLLLGTSDSMKSIRGKIIDFMGIKVIPTYHPSYILRSGGTKKDLLRDDFSLARSVLVEQGISFD